jgi:hypothetical protein
MVRKVKIVKKPKFDLTKLMELYRERPEDARADRGEGEPTAANTLTAGQE